MKTDTFIALIIFLYRPVCFGRVSFFNNVKMKHIIFIFSFINTDQYD